MTELQGRELDLAVLQAMDWRIEFDEEGVEGFIYNAEGKWSGSSTAGCYECGRSQSGWPTEEELRDWLHKRGEIEAYSNSRGASMLLCYTDQTSGWIKAKGSSPSVRGETYQEAIKRLVIAIRKEELAAQQ